MIRAIPTLALLLLLALPATAQMRNNRLFKVDPASWMFRELRVAVENRLFKGKDFFWYLAPYGYHQYWLAKDNERYGRPTHPQKYYGLGFRYGIRHYFLPEASSPHGFFFQGMLGYRHTWLNNYNDGLTLVARDRYHSVGLGATVGYQWLYGPGFVPRKNFAYGFMGGLEYNVNLFRPDSPLTNDGLTRNWYDFPFLPIRGFRFYLGIEVGFAFLQKRLHW